MLSLSPFAGVPMRPYTEHHIPPLSLNVAHADFSCAAAQAGLWSFWFAFVATGMPSPIINPIHNSFGGYIAGVVPCWNGVIAFTTNPTFAGIGGPYGVYPVMPPLYAYWNVRPLARTVGNAPLLNVCMLCIPSHPHCCIFPPVMQSAIPGMGTSAI